MHVDKFKKEILCIESSQLDKHITKEFSLIDKSVLETILDKSIFLERGLLEEDATYRQIIPYTILLYKKTIFVYKRSAVTKVDGEERLSEKYSIGVGGHVERDRHTDTIDLLLKNAKREILEETEIVINVSDLKPIGFIKLNHDVHKFHLGICYIAKVLDTKYKFQDDEIENGEFMQIEDLLELSSKKDIEEWSQVLITHLNDILK